MILWRLTKRHYADLSGKGGELFDARWHTRGRPIVYLAATPALALLEVRVHLELSPGSLPDDYVLMRVHAPDDVASQTVRPRDLPDGWQQSEQLCRPVGDSWLEGAVSALLRVPSATIEVEHNVLFNPQHPDASRLQIEETTPFKWDQRLFRP
jgi:RES domain-containing protein